MIPRPTLRFKVEPRLPAEVGAASVRVTGNQVEEKELFEVNAINGGVDVILMMVQPQSKAATIANQIDFVKRICATVHTAIVAQGGK